MAGLVGMRWWHGRLDIPLDYAGDALSSQLLVKTAMKSWTAQTNTDLGAPFKLEMQDYPLGGDNLNFIIMRGTSLVTENSSVAINLFFFATFALCGMMMYSVSRLLDVSRIPSMAMAIVFACAPFHFGRGQIHLLLSAYYMVPIGIYLAIRIGQGKGFGATRGSLPKVVRYALPVVACIALASAGVYYAAFSLLLIGALAVGRAISGRSWKPLGVAAVVILIIAGTSVVNQIPTLQYRAEHGENSQVAQRIPMETEVYPLVITRYLVPAVGHPIGRFRHATDTYWAATPLKVIESDPAGAMASIGLLTAFFVAFLRLISRNSATTKSSSPLRLVDVVMTDPRVGLLTAATLVLVLFATAGGLASPFAWLVSPSIRAWGRATIVIAALSLLLLGVLAQQWLGPRRPRILVALAIFAVPVALVDQATPGLVPTYDVNRHAYRSDERFVQELEEKLPEKSMILQLPMQTFPEGTPIPGQGFSYDNARGYLHSKNLRWSFPAMRGRPEDISPLLSSLPVEMLAEAAERLGFDAIWIDRRADQGNPTWEATFREQGQKKITESETGDTAAFRLTAHPDAKETAAKVLDRATAFLSDGIYPTEQLAPEQRGQWLSQSGKILVRSPQKATLLLRGRLYSGDEKDRKINIVRDENLVTTVTATPEGTDLWHKVEVPKGNSTITLYVEGKPIVAPQDPRVLTVKWINPSVEDFDALQLVAPTLISSRGLTNDKE